MTAKYRERFGMRISSGILFNHESQLHGIEFVTHRITGGVARIKPGLADHLTPGNTAARDWGQICNYMREMWLIFQQEAADNDVVVTGRTTSAVNFCAMVFAAAGLSMDDHVRTDPALLRPAGVDVLPGDVSKSERQLGWRLEVTLEQLASEMVEADIVRPAC